MGALLRRAWNDGLTFYRREKITAYLSWAEMDLLTTLADLAEALKRGKKIRSAIPALLPWRFRQAGFICGYITDGFAPWRLLNVAAGMAGRGMRYALQLMKRPIRKIVVAARKPARSRRRIPAQPDHLLVAACGFLGDMVLLAPVLEGLRHSLPDAHITLLCHPNGKVLLGQTGLVDEVMVCPTATECSWREREKRIATQLGRRRFDAVITPYYHNAPPRPVFLGTGAPVVTFDRDVGFSRRLWYELAARRVTKDFTRHEIVNLTRLAETVGLRNPPRPYRLAIPPEAREKALKLLEDEGVESHDLILLHAGAGYPEKAWPVENWSRLAEMIEAELHRTPVFIGDRAIRPEMARGLGELSLRAVNLCGETSLWEMAALIAEADLLVTTDSGPKHLAMALGTPTLTLYGPTGERRWGALWDREDHAAVRAVPADLTPEELLDLPRNYAMMRLTPESVLSALETHWDHLKRRKDLMRITH